MVVAVSDDNYGGAGGTVDVIAIAAGLDIPVIKISTAEPEIFVMHAADLDAPDQTPKPHEKLEPNVMVPGGLVLPEKFSGFLKGLLEPPKLPPPSAKSHDEAPPARERLEWFFSERSDPRYFHRIFKAFRNGLTVEAEA